MKKLFTLLMLFACFQANAELIASVEHDTDSVILRFPLWDVADPKLCATDITNATTGLEINVSSDNSDGYIDQFRQTDTTLNVIATIGTFATPDANDANFEIIVAGSCIYELQMPNSIFATSGATQINVEVTDSNTQIIDSYFWVDLTPVSAATLIDQMLDTAVSGYTTPGDWGYQLRTVLDAILVDTGTTLESTANQIAADTSAFALNTGTADSGNQTSFVDAALTEADANYWAKDIAVVFTSGSIAGQVFCVSSFVPGTDTINFTPAATQSVSTNTYTLIAAPGCDPFR